MSLRLRLTLWYGLLLALGLLAFGTLLYVVLRANLERRVDEALRLRAAQIVRDISAGQDGLLDAADLPPGLLWPQSIDEAVGPDLYVQVLDARARFVGASGTQLPIDPETVLAALEGRESLTGLPLSGGRTVRLLTRPIQAGGRVVGVVQVGETLDAVAATLDQVRDILLIGSLLVMGAAIAGGLVLAGRALAPVRRVSATAAAIAATADYARRLPTPGTRDEVDELVRTFNALIARVELSLEEQRRFLADTSHELRSPLTVIRANLGFLWRDTDPETRADCLRESEAEAARMSRLVSDLLLLGQAEAGELLVLGRVELDGVVGEVVEQARAQGAGRVVRVEALEPVVVAGDRDRLRQAVWNLAENALRYTPPDGEVRFALTHDAGWAVLRVADDGPGIPPEHLPRVFDRFYRVDRARSRATGGSGLGLAIVRHIAQAHGGGVGLESVVGRGSTFSIRIPAEPTAARDAAERPAGRRGLVGAGTYGT